MEATPAQVYLHGGPSDPHISSPLVDLLALDQSKTFYKPDWFDIVGAEVKCCKEAVCVIDMSSFTKFEISVSVVVGRKGFLLSSGTATHSGILLFCPCLSFLWE